MDGEVIGINVAKLSNTQVEGFGYSIPIYKVMEAIEDKALDQILQEQLFTPLNMEHTAYNPPNRDRYLPRTPA